MVVWVSVVVKMEMVEEDTLLMAEKQILYLWFE